MIIIDDLLTKDQQDLIETTALRIPWFYQDNTCDFSYIPNYPQQIEGVKETPFFVNMLYDEFQSQSDYSIYFTPIVRVLEQRLKRPFMKRLFRMKANMYLQQPNYPDGCFHTPHVDVYDEKTDTIGEGEIFLYYVDASDGPTYMFNERFPSASVTKTAWVIPEKGKGVLFDLQTQHASSPPRFHERRITLNFVFTK
jgi:hypothetical protein